MIRSVHASGNGFQSIILVQISMVYERLAVSGEGRKIVAICSH